LGVIFAEDAISDPRISVGRWTYGLTERTFKLVRPDDRIEIGSFCSFAKEVVILRSSEHVVGVTTYPLFSLMIDPSAETQESRAKGPTWIGSDVWVGWGAMILSGVSIGHGGIVGAGAVVASDVPPYAVVVGNPARILRMRYDDHTLARLLATQWWTWDDDVIRERAELFSDVERFLVMAEGAPTRRSSGVMPKMGPETWTPR